MSPDSISPRARASRREDARSRGPLTAAGRARVALNGLGHGPAARDLMLLDDEDPAAFAAFEAAARRELAPAGALQADLVRRIVSAAWRAQRADRLEAGLMGHYLPELPPLDERERQAAFGLGLIRDGNGPRALETLVRYRASVQAELFRALGALKALQSESPTDAAATLPALPAPNTKRTRES